MKPHYLSLVFPALLLLSENKLYAQGDSTHTNNIISAQFGINEIKDENLHPKVSTGTITMIGYGFEKEKKHLQQFQFSLGYSRLKTKLEDLSKSANFKINTAYSYNFKLLKNGRFTYYLGPELSVAYDASYFPNWDDSHLYWADYIALNAKSYFALNCNKEREWLTAVSFPLFGMYNRPELYRLYKIDDTDVGGIASNINKDFKPGFWGNLFHVDVRTEYRFPAFTSKKEAFFYAFQWKRIDHPNGNPFNQLSHQIGIKFIL